MDNTHFEYLTCHYLYKIYKYKGMFGGQNKIDIIGYRLLYLVPIHYLVSKQHDRMSQSYHFILSCLLVIILSCDRAELETNRIE